MRFIETNIIKPEVKIIYTDDIWETKANNVGLREVNTQFATIVQDDMLIRQKNWDKKLLKDISNVMRDASICGLGQAAANPLDSVLKFFKHEIE